MSTAMSHPLSGKTALVTGGARRVGAAICRRLHALGANIVLNYRSSVNEARELQHELNGKRANSTALVEADLLHIAELPRLVSETLNQFGSLDILVNNASSFYATPLGDVTEKAWDDLVGSNLKAPLFLAQAAAAELKERRGCIVNIVDIHAEFPLKNYVVYSVAKGGLLTLTRALARELGPEVRVNGVAPGAILWPESGEWQDEVSRQRIVHQTALKRVGEPDDIAKAVEFLVTSSPYVTGQIINVDGGRSILV